MLKIHFAPIQGYTDCAYRNAHVEIFGGVECYYTPFVRLEHGEMRNKDIRETLPDNDTTGKTVPQILVKDGEEFRTLVNRLKEMGYRRIDVNMGCPFPLQVRKGRGAGILSHPDKVKEVLDTINQETEVDFSVKMRLGNTSVDESLNLVPMINDTRLVHVTLHPRIATQQYKGEPDCVQFRTFLQLCNHDVIYNGDILTIEDIERIARIFPEVKAVMVGRGLLMRPSLAMEYAGQMKFDENRLLGQVLRLHDRLFDHYSQTLQGESHLLMKMKTFWEYLEGVIGHKCYKSIKKAVTIAKYNAAIATI